MNLIASPLRYKLKEEEQRETYLYFDMDMGICVI